MTQSGEQPVTTIALSIKHVLDKFSKSTPRLQFVYDENLTYETAVSKHRRDNPGFSSTSTPPFPLLAIRRSALRWQEAGMGRRSVTHRALDVGSDTSSIYKFVFGEFDLEFLFMHNQTFETEAFEINYLSELGISNDHTIDIELPEIGVFKNYCSFSELENKEFNDIDNFFQSMSGRAVVKGVFMILDPRYTGAKRIKEINTVIKDLNTSNVYSQFTID